METAQLKMAAQPSDLGKYEKVYNSISFIDIELRFGALVAETAPYTRSPNW